MRRIYVIVILISMVFLSSCSGDQGEDFVFVKGSSFVNTRSNLYGKNVTIEDFSIGRYEVTQKEWKDIMGNNPSEFQGDDLPVETVSWYDCIEYCNKRSIQEGLTPYYNIDKDNKDSNNLSEFDDIKWTVTINAGAKGYRLPTEAEWEYAAGGGQKSSSYTYSGSDDADEVAWYYKNSGDEYISGEWMWPTIEGNNNKTQPVGSKKANELGIYDMSGNVREWCWDWYGEVLDSSSGYVRVWRGGGWLGDAQACETAYRGNYEANGKGYDQGLRICRSED